MDKSIALSVLGHLMGVKVSGEVHVGNFGGRCYVAAAISAAYPDLHNQVIVASHHIGNLLKTALLVEASRTLVVLVDHEH